MLSTRSPYGQSGVTCVIAVCLAGRRPFHSLNTGRFFLNGSSGYASLPMKESILSIHTCTFSNQASKCRSQASLGTGCSWAQTSGVDSEFRLYDSCASNMLTLQDLKKKTYHTLWGSYYDYSARLLPNKINYFVPSGLYRALPSSFWYLLIIFPLFHFKMKSRKTFIEKYNKSSMERNPKIVINYVGTLPNCAFPKMLGTWTSGVKELNWFT